MKKLFFTLCVTAFLSGCGGREQADTKLARACESAVKVMLNKSDYDRQIDKVKGKKIGMSDGYRLVTIDVLSKTKEFSNPKDESFECKFDESMGPFGFGYHAALVSLKIDDVVYGSNGGEIYGSIQDQMAIMTAVEQALK